MAEKSGVKNKRERDRILFFTHNFSALSYVAAKSDRLFACGVSTPMMSPIVFAT
jgi:hypothetical protein